jgi:hypothetical protein
VSITLDAVASCGVITQTYPMLLVLAAIAALLGIFQFSDSGASSSGMMVGVAILSLAAYFVTRKSSLSVTSAGAAIEVPASGMSHKDLVDFVDALEEAKLDFIGGLKKRTSD